YNEVPLGKLNVPAIIARALMLALALGATLPAARPVAPDSTQAASQSMEAKMRILQSTAVQRGSYPAGVITENEANSYLKVDSPEFLPPGVHQPNVNFQPEHVTGSADVNFDEFSRVSTNPNDWGPKVMAAMFKGNQRGTATGKDRKS